MNENKKKNEINKLKEHNRSMEKMIEGMKAAHEEKLNSIESELEKFEITVAEVETCTAMLMKDEHRNEIERDK